MPHVRDFARTRVPRDGGVEQATEAKLADADSHGHQTAPINLTPEQIRALAAYIESFK